MFVQIHKNYEKDIFQLPVGLRVVMSICFLVGEHDISFGSSNKPYTWLPIRNH